MTTHARISSHPGARAGGTTVHRGTTALFAAARIPVSGLLAWDLDHAEVRPAVSSPLRVGLDGAQSEGCFSLDGIPTAGPYRLAVWAPHVQPVIADIADPTRPLNSVICSENVWAPQTVAGGVLEGVRLLAGWIGIAA